MILSLSIARHRAAIMSACMVAALGLSACQEQQGASTTSQVRQAAGGSAIVQVARAAEPRMQTGDANIGSAARLDAYLARIRTEARESRQQALQMRQQVIAYKEAVAEARAEAARYREDILRIRADIARERAEMEKYRAEIDTLLKDISAQAARIRADRDYIRQLARQTEQAKKQIALIRQGVQQMRDDMLPKAALTTSSVSALRQPAGKAASPTEIRKSASGKGVARPVTGLSLTPASSQPRQPAKGSAAVKVRVPRQQER